MDLSVRLNNSRVYWARVCFSELQSVHVHVHVHLRTSDEKRTRLLNRVPPHHYQTTNHQPPTPLSQKACLVLFVLGRTYPTPPPHPPLPFKLALQRIQMSSGQGMQGEEANLALEIWKCGVGLPESQADRAQQRRAESKRFLWAITAWIELSFLPARREQKIEYRKYVIRKDGVGRWVHLEVTVAAISIIALSTGPPIGAACGGAGRRFSRTDRFSPQSTAPS